jgi:hypothetical protein
MMGRTDLDRRWDRRSGGLALTEAIEDDEEHERHDDGHDDEGFLVERAFVCGLSVTLAGSGSVWRPHAAPLSGLLLASIHR